MAVKIKTVNLTYLGMWDGKPDQYRVDQVTDTTSPSPGELLTKLQVDDLCKAGDWKIIIKAYKK